MISMHRLLLCALLLSLLTACGGSQSSGAEEKSATGVEASAPEAAPASEEATLARAAELNTASLAAAEKRAQAADAKGATSASSSSTSSSVTATALDKLTPGQIAPKSAYASGDIARKALAVGITAYRFYNGSTGAHFYTVSQAERDHVRNNLSPPYSYEGDAFRVASAYAPGLSPVHRFYNTRNGVHFYTISEAERAYVVANLKHYTYEGVAYHASEVAGANLIPFHRFYVPSKGFHFYTASEEEKNNIIANLGATYRYEGVGYYVLDTRWNAEKLPHTGIPASACYWTGSNALQSCNDDRTRALNPWQDGYVAFQGVGLDYGPVPRPEFSDTYTYTECVLDKITGLIWEGKNPNPDQPRYGGALLTNLGNGAANDVSGHVAAVNASRLCGFSDWRVPSLMELHSIVHYGNSTKALVDPRFVNTLKIEYWTRDRYDPSNRDLAWTVNFNDLSGAFLPLANDNQRPVRLVRGAPLESPAIRYTYTTLPYPGDGANNTVNDSWTGLQWRRCEEGRTWNGTTCTGIQLKGTHEAVLARARQLPGWRVPNIKELGSLFDVRRNPDDWIDPVAFPGACLFPGLWSSTPDIQFPTKAWSASCFTDATLIYRDPRSVALSVRLVRVNYPFAD